MASPPVCPRPCSSILLQLLSVWLPALLVLTAQPQLVAGGASLSLFNASVFLPGHALPSGSLPPALPQYCPLGASLLPRTLLLNPCALELSTRLAAAAADLGPGAGLMSAQDLLLSRVPEARLYFTFRSPHLDPRKWSAALPAIRAQADAVIAAQSFYSVINKTSAAPGVDARFFFADVAHTLPIEPAADSTAGGTAAEPAAAADGSIDVALLLGSSVSADRSASLSLVQSSSEDAVALTLLAHDVRTLALGWRLLANDTYAHRAVHLLHTWFIHPSASMRPSADYADWHSPDDAVHVGEDALLKLLPLIDIIDSVALLRSSPRADQQWLTDMQAWFTDYLYFLTTAPLALSIGARSDYRAVLYLVQVVAVGAFTEQPRVVRQAIDYGLADMETQVRRHGTIPQALLQPSPAAVWQFQFRTMLAFTLLATQAQFLTDTAQLNAPLSKTARQQDGGATFVRTSASTGLRPGESAAAAAANAAAVAIAAVSAMDPSAAAYLALPDVLQYNMDGSVPRSDSLFQLVANFLHDSQTNLRAWTTAALAEPPVPVPSSGVQLSVVLWRLSSVWESPWYPNRFLRAVVNCPVYVNPALPYECFTTLADRLAPLRVDQMEWIDMGAFARVRPPLATASGAAAADTKVIGWFASVGLFDRAAVPLFITLGIFGLLRWSTFFIRFIPALIFLFFESRRRRHHRSLLYTAERDATIIVPTIDSGPELKAAITSWLRNRPKRIIFATIHRETHSIIRLLKETCEEFEAQQQKEAEAKAARGNVTNEFLGAEWVHRDVDIEDGLQAKPNPASAPISELVHEVSPTPASTPLLNAELAWRTQVDVISVSRPNKRQQMVAALAHVDTDIFVLADDDAIWPDTCLQLQLACFDDPRIGGVGTEQRMRPIPRGTPGASWFRIGDATCWEIIADFRLTAKLLDNAASVWFGTSVSCLSGRTAAYRTCIVKPTAQQGPCNPKANRLFHVDKFGFRPEDYTSAQQLCTQLQHKLNRCEMFSDSLNAADIRQLVTHKNKLHPVAQRHGGQQPSASSDSSSRTASHSRDASNSDHEERKRDGAIEPGRCHNPAAVAHGHFAESAECSTSAASSFATAPPAPQYAMPESAAPIKCDSAAVADDFDAALSLVNSECQVRQLPTAPRVESRALPLLFFSFCIEFCNDYFIQPWDAAQLHSGDDKFLTRYITRRGWLMYTQTGDAAAVETTFKPNWRFLLQYMRWTRNTWRSDFRSLAKERAVWKSPHYWFLVFLMIDKCIAPFTLLFGPVLIFNVAMHSSLGLHATPDDADRPYRLPLWNVIASYVVWICLTRAFRIFPHFFRKPIHLLAIPFHVALQYLLAVLKIYCLFTLHVTDWGTRAVDEQDPPRPAPVKPQKADPPVPASMV